MSEKERGEKEECVCVRERREKVCKREWGRESEIIISRKRMSNSRRFPLPQSPLLLKKAKKLCIF